MRKLVLLMAVLFSGVAMAQETVERKKDGWVVVKDGNGEFLRTFFSPTPQLALEAIQREDGNGTYAAMVLSQKFETRSATELDAFADELKRLVLESPSIKVAEAAVGALQSYKKRGLEILIDIYEVMDGTEVGSKEYVLAKIFRLPGGEDYVMNLYASLSRPKEPCKLRPQTIPMVDGKRIGPPVPPEEEQCPYKTQWCEVAMHLSRMQIMGEDVNGVDPIHVLSICDKRYTFRDGEWSLIQQ